MYLKLVELHGFKTFAERCQLQFDSGVTAVVGPNGSGKSNIADAIQWALGEQSLKSLRSGKARDVIFSGTDGRRAVGLAEVSLTFDNADRALPLEFDEVSVTRRVHRSGEGDYFINRIPCRLRDIQELFLDTGIGKEAYSVVNQAEIDAILSIRSEDRRELFEEVAGIKKYRVKRREAERRLEHTRTNLIRVTDIINELEQQLGPLAQQSETARRHQELAAELTALKRALLVSRYRALLESQERVRSRIEELSRRREQIRAQGESIETSEQEARAQLGQAEDLVEQARGEAARLLAQAAEAEREAALRQERLTALEARRAHLEADLEQLRSRQAQTQAEMGQAGAEGQRLAAECEALGQRLETLEADLAQAEGGVESGREQVEAARRDYVGCLEEAAGGRNALAQADSLLESARRSLARLTQRRRQEQEQAHRAAAEAQAIEAEIQHLEGERDRLRETVAARGQELEKAVAARDQHLARAADLRERLSGAVARRKALMETAASAEGHAPAVRAVTQAAREGALSGEFRLIPDLVAAAAQHERAIEAAIGPAVDFIVTPTRGQAAQAVAYLNAQQAGRAAFLPLDGLHPTTTLEPPAGAWLALDLIECEPRHRPVFEQLLGQVLVAPDLEAASELAERMTGWRKIVTLGGEVLYPSGAICGGSPGREARLMSRRREIEDLAATAESLRSDLEAATGQADKAAAAMARLRAEAQGAGPELEASDQQVASRRDALRARQGEARQAEGYLAESASEVEALERDIADNASQHDRAAAQVSDLEARQAEATQALEAAEEGLEKAQAHRRALEDRLVATRLGLTEARAQAGACQASTQRCEKALGEIAEAMAQRRRAMAEAEENRTRTSQEQETCAARCRELEAAREGAEQAVAEAAARRDRIGDTLGQGADRRKAHGQQLEEIQARLHRAELRATQIESETGYVTRNLWEDHRIEAEAALAQDPPLQDRRAAQARADELEAALAEMGQVNLGAVEEYERVSERLRFLTGQRADLDQARDDIHRAIAELDATSRDKFMEAFEAIAREFDALFQRLFDGGSTELVICDPEQVLESGIDVHVQLPGKRRQNILLLSGGERALTALALVLAMLRVRPSPFVILDEIDAPLDATNVGKYTEVLKEFARRSQFIIITHNPGTMEAADVLHGVTMERHGVSKLVSVRLTDGGRGEPAWASAPH